MTRKELMAELKANGVAFKATMKTVELEELFNQVQAEKAAAEKEEKKMMAKDEKFMDVTYLVPMGLRTGVQVKRMSNNSCAVKEGNKRLFRLDRIKNEYQLTSDRDTLTVDNRVEVCTKKNNKVFYRFRGTKAEVTAIMKKVLAN